MSSPPTDIDSLSDETSDEVSETIEGATAVAAPAAVRRKRLSGDTAATGQTSQVLPAARLGDSNQATASAMGAAPVEALRREEVARTRIFLRVVLVIIAVFAPAVLLMEGPLLGESLLAAVSLVLALVTARTLIILRDPQRHRPFHLTYIGYLLTLGAFVGVYHVGAFSPAPALVLLSIYFFSLGGSTATTLGLYLTCVVAQAALAGLTLLGVLPGPPLMDHGALSVRDAVIVQLLVQLLYSCAYVIGRASRRATAEAVAELERAVRAVAQREAQLHEARQDLDRALAAGGFGRYSDAQIGSFQLGALIGRGGMGEVYEAVHLQSAERAAVKLLYPHVLANPDHLARFRRELEAVSSLDSPNVVRVLEVGSEHELPYLAMELLEGHDLAHVLRRRRRLSPARAIALAEQIGAGLAAARAAGIVHRDIKPQNLFLAREGNGASSWKILDFGVSKLAGAAGTLTRGHVVGTPGYMAPEQARGEVVDYRADLYALAAILYRALTGHPPFSNRDVPTTLYDVVYKMPARPSSLAPLSEQLDYVLAIGLAKRVDDRFGSSSELTEALASAARDELSEQHALHARDLLRRHGWGESK